MTQGKDTGKLFTTQSLAAIGASVVLVTWPVTGSWLLAVGLSVIVMAVAALVCALNPRCRKSVDIIENSTQRAAQLVSAARLQLDTLTARAAETDDDEVKFRANRLKNTVTLLLEALQDTPNRHGELTSHLSHTLPKATEITEAYVTQSTAIPDDKNRNAFLRYLQETELQFEYAVRSFVSGGRGKSTAS